MASKNYRNGADFERAFKKHLEGHPDCILAVRSAGSHGPVDLIALFRDPNGVVTRLYQLKYGERFRIKPEELAALKIYNEFPGVEACVVFRAKRPERYGATRPDGSKIGSHKTLIWSVEEAERWSERRATTS